MRSLAQCLTSAQIKTTASRDAHSHLSAMKFGNWPCVSWRERPHLEDCLQFFTLSSGMAHAAKRGIKNMVVREIKGTGDNGSLEKQEKVQGLYVS